MSTSKERHRYQGKEAIALHASNHRIVFHTKGKRPVSCPTCGKILIIAWMLQDVFPYLHVDLCLRCILCEYDYVFGIAIDKGFGLETIVWDTEPSKVLAHAEKLLQPVCPFHTKKMVLTKIWGDLVMVDQEYMKVQWKCPEWYYTVQGDYPRFEVGNRDDSVHSQRIRERLKALGYV